MSIDESIIDKRLAYAEERRDEALLNSSVTTVVYWNGYVEGLRAIKRDQNERNLKND